MNKKDAATKKTEEVFIPGHNEESSRSHDALLCPVPRQVEAPNDGDDLTREEIAVHGFQVSVYDRLTRRDAMIHYTLLLLTLLSLSSALSARVPFVVVKNGLSNQERIPFDRSWLYGNAAEKIDMLHPECLPQHLGIPEYVRVYERDEEAVCCSPTELARAARSIVNSELVQHGAILFRDLNIETAQDFKKFWKACCDGGWKPASYVPFGPNRARLQDVDLATNILPQNALPPHNEMAYNPRPPSKIAFYCLQHAREGGETLVVMNKELTDSIRNETLDLVKRDGLLYVRRYRDENHHNTALGMSWQEKCETHDKQEAIQFFTDLGFNRSDIRFDENGTLTISFEHSGFIYDGASGRDLWFNIFSTGVPKRLDGSDYPWETVAQTQLDEWGPVCAFKLKKGDWLVLDNKSIQHGRLPYTDDPSDPPRTLLTVYTE